MPNSTSYTIKSGDTLSAIAAQLGTSVDALARENGIQDPSRIAVGQVLKVPGTVGAASASPTPAPAPVAPGGGDDWAALIAGHGNAEARADFAAGKRVVVALRKPTNTKANQGLGVYDDRMVVVQRVGGALKTKEFPCTTEPSGQYASEGKKASKGSTTDLDGDHRMDLGRLRAGNYRYQSKPGGHLGQPAFRARDTQVAERDVNHDGDFNDADGNRIDPTGAQQTMLIHVGGSTNTFSAGCQTVPPAHFNAFLASLGGQNAFSYVLIDQKA
jgi:murein DD-endopeptidase MepM/ murein hydrolase activator NlpD